VDIDPKCGAYLNYSDMFLMFTVAAEYLEDIYTIIKQPTGKPKTIQIGNFAKC